MIVVKDTKTGSVTIAAQGTKEVITATSIGGQIIGILMGSGNTGTIVFGGAEETAPAFGPFGKNKFFAYPIMNLNKVAFIGTNNGDTFTYIYLS